MLYLQTADFHTGPASRTQKGTRELIHMYDIENRFEVINKLEF